MATNKGVIQGYTGVAAVDARRQIIVDAQAHGTGSEQELLGPVVQAMQAMQATPSSVYRAEDFTYDAAARTCVCPAGQSLYRKGRAGDQRLRGGGVPRNDRRVWAVRAPPPRPMRPGCVRGSIRRKGARSTGSASRRWSRCLGTCVTTRGSTASRCADGPRSMGSGSSTAWCTTSKSSPGCWCTSPTRGTSPRATTAGTPTARAAGGGTSRAHRGRPPRVPILPEPHAHRRLHHAGVGSHAAGAATRGARAR